MTKPEEQKLWDYLNAKNIPWRESRKTLTDRYGAKICELSGDEIVILGEDTKIMEYMLRPLAFNAHKYNNSVPPLRFNGIIHKENNFQQNIDFGYLRLREFFGEPHQNETIGNVLVNAWNYGKASISLTVWPTKLNDFTGDKNKYNCLVQINTGFRLPLSSAETLALTSFEPLPAPSGSLPPHRNDIEASLAIARNHPPAPALPISLGLDKTGNYLISIDHDEIFFIPTNSILKFSHERVESGSRGNGKSSLYLNYQLSGSTSPFNVINNSTTGGLDEFAKTLAAKLNKPLESETYPNE